MTTYQILTGDKNIEGSIKYFVNHSLVPSIRILASAQSFIYSHIRVREMKALQTGTLAIGETTLDLPADYLAPIFFGLSGDYQSRIDVLDEELFESALPVQTDGTLYSQTPRSCTIDGSLIRFDAAMDQAYLYRLRYYKTPASLSASVQSNFLSTRYEHLLEAMCKYYAYMHRQQSDKAGDWMQIAMDAINQANIENDMHNQALHFEMHG
jgi:hypothetical protein